MEVSGGPARTQAFAQFTVAGEVGALAGPLLGALLLVWDFRVACWAAAALFVLITLGHLCWLPNRAAQHAGEPLFSGWSEVLRNRVFLVFAVGYSGYLLTYTQMYLLLPLEVRRVTGVDWPLGWFFAFSAGLVILVQVPATSWSMRRLGTGRGLSAGFLLMAAGAAVLALAAPLGLRGAPGVAPAVLFVLLLTIGQILVVPLARAVVSRLADERRLGAYFGVLSSVSGCAVVVGTTGTGLLLDVAPSRGPGAALPWALVAVIPFLSWLVVRGMARRGVLAGTS